MKEPQQEFPQTEKIDINSVVPKIIGEFHLKNYHYLVIHLEHNIENSTEANLTLSAKVSLTPEMIQFAVNGELCAIVVSESDRLDTKSDISLLLTERELQIVKLVALGKPNKQIASQLYISEWTVSTHLRRIFAKLGVDSRAAMVHRCASLLT
ncbi:response regulator transcription factor [Scytonema hofmannii]|uniref:response regulator transcription factor n=1 Tax=Scytonema hofmannii TaxID=34078 RepID=UPI00034C9B98|nr:LuxR C-terminal-related transcriptional regulator [Scytonema hofmannii]